MCSAAAAAETEKECFETFHNDPYHAITGTQKMVHLSFKDTTYPPPPPPVLLLDRLLPLVLRGRHLPFFSVSPLKAEFKKNPGFYEAMKRFL